jgi:hypothetical protein
MTPTLSSLSVLCGILFVAVVLLSLVVYFLLENYVTLRQRMDRLEGRFTLREESFKGVNKPYIPKRAEFEDELDKALGVLRKDAE